MNEYPNHTDQALCTLPDCCNKHWRYVKTPDGLIGVCQKHYRLYREAKVVRLETPSLNEDQMLALVNEAAYYFATDPHYVTEVIQKAKAVIARKAARAEQKRARDDETRQAEARSLVRT